MLLSIIVPTYNVETYLANCLDSLVEQDLPTTVYEILVINDGSTDKSPEIAAAYEEKYEQIKVFNQENQGLSAARNQGLKLAKGQYVYFIDSDDYIARNTLDYALSMMQKHELDVLGLRVMNTAELDVKEAKNYEVMNTEALRITDGITYIAENRYLNNAWWYIIRRDYLVESGLIFPVGRFVEDANFTAQLIAGSSRIARSTLDFYRYVIRPDSIMRKRSKEHTLKMIGDYEKNVFDFETQLSRLRKNSHPNIELCLERLEARQQSFVFFLIVKCIKNQLKKSEIAPILDRLQTIGAYPMKKFISRDYNGISYRVLVFIMNRRSLLFASGYFFPLLNRLFPKI